MCERGEKVVFAFKEFYFTLVYMIHVEWESCWHVKPRWFASWRFDEDLMKLFWTILKPLPLKWSLHWWRKGDLMISMVIKAGTCSFHVVTSLWKCIC